MAEEVIGGLQPGSGGHGVVGRVAPVGAGGPAVLGQGPLDPLAHVGVLQKGHLHDLHRLGRGIGAVQPVLQDDGDGIAGVVIGGEGHEQAVVPQAPGQVGGVPLLGPAAGIAVAVHLGRAGLARHLDVAEVQLADLEGRAAHVVGHRRHGLAHDVDPLLREGQVAELVAPRPLHPAHRLDQPGQQGLLAVGQARGHHRQLQGIHLQGPLADAVGQAFACEPGLVGRVLLVHPLLPGGGGHGALALALDADVEGVTQPEGVRHLGDAVRADAQGHLVEIDVAAGLDGFGHVHRPVAVGLPAVEVAAAIEELARALDAVVLGHQSRLQGGHGRHGLEGGAGRVEGRDRLVQQGLVVIVVQGPVLRLRHAGDETVGVEAGGRHQAQKVAGVDVDHHGCATVLAEHLQGAVLHVRVQGQDHVRSGGGLAVPGGVLADHPADAVHLDLLAAGTAAQLRVQGLLHPGLADAEARMQQQRVDLPVRRGLAGPLQVRLADLGDIADHVGEGAAKGIDPALPHVGSDAGQLRQAGIDPGELPPGQVVGDGDGHGAGGDLQVPQHLLAPGRGDGDQQADLVDQALRIVHLVPPYQQAEVRAVGGDGHPVAVQDPAPGRRDQPEAELVLAGHGLVAGGLGHLQL